MIRVLLADDHQLVRDGLKQILGQSADIQIAAEAATGDEALAQVKAREFDIVLLDLSMPGLSGIALIKRLKLEKPKLRILVLSMHAESQYAARALRAGAMGYLTKDSASEQLIGAIRKIAAGGVYLSDVATQGLLVATVNGDSPPHTRLSDREFEIFKLIANGFGLTEIGQQLNLSVKTVSTHKTHLLEKMNLANAAELVRYALEHDLLERNADT
jgi:two-component system, NarL family, invasion response regulator UvrY